MKAELSQLKVRLFFFFVFCLVFEKFFHIIFPYLGEFSTLFYGIVKLLFCDELNTRILNKLDLFNISEIKRPKGGGIEIKFYDRLKALQCLQELYNGQSSDTSGFYRALEQGVKTFEEDES